MRGSIRGIAADCSIDLQLTASSTTSLVVPEPVLQGHNLEPAVSSAWL